MRKYKPTRNSEEHTASHVKSITGNDIVPITFKIILKGQFTQKRRFRLTLASFQMQNRKDHVFIHTLKVNGVQNNFSLDTIDYHYTDEQKHTF